MKHLLFAFAALGAAACSGSSASPQISTVTGTFAGQALDIADSASFQGTTGMTSYLDVVLSSTSGICSVAVQQAAKANTNRLELLIQNIGASNATPLAAGVYTVTNGDPAVTGNDAVTGASAGYLQVSANYNTYDASCAPTLAPTASGATSGTITVDATTAADVSGSFDLRFPGGDHLSGRFASPVCVDQHLALAPPPAGAGGVGGASTAPTAAVAASACLP